MIKETKSKVFMITMLSLSFIVISLLAVVNVVNYKQSRQESYSIVNNASNMLMHNPPNMPMDMKIDNKESNDINKPMLYWNTNNFYFVILDKDNNIIKIVNENTNGYTDNEIGKYALKVSSKNKKNGSVGNLVYNMKTLRNEKFITFKDNTIANRYLKNSMAISLLIGIISLGFVYFISKKISIWIIKPIEETLNKQKQFISDASHELKTPLAVIRANADTLEGEVGGSKWLNYIQNEITSMDKLVNNLLGLAKMEKEEKSDFKDFNISKTIMGGTMVFESLAFENEIILKDDIDDNLKLHGNSEEMKQLLSILLDNAIKHTKKKGQIIVSLKKYKQKIILKVKNTGDPISKEDQEKIFERFYRVDKSRNRDNKRYGLGLSIAKAIVNKHKGKINVTSMNGFTTFTVIF